MKVQALRKFRDKYTREVYSAGDRFEVTEERFAEINAGKSGVLVEEIMPDPPAPPAADGLPTPAQESSAEEQKPDMPEPDAPESQPDPPAPPEKANTANKNTRRSAANG